LDLKTDEGSWQRVAIGTLCLLASPVAAVEGGLAFYVVQVGGGEALEPTLSYAPNGTLWYSGMTELSNVFPRNANLWWASTDTSSFLQETDPPTFGGADAVVHHDSNGRLFFAEGVRPTRVAVRHNTVWQPSTSSGVDTVTTIPNADRPWLVTLSNGTTYLAVWNRTDTVNPNADIVEVYRNATGVYGWELDTKNATGAKGLAAFANDTADTLYILAKSFDQTQWKVAMRPSASNAWSDSASFSFNADPNVNTGFGIPRMVTDLWNNLYVVYGDNRTESGVEQFSIWLRRYEASSDSWTAPFRIAQVNHSAALAGVGAGSTGMIGVSWYDAEGRFFPSSADATTQWDVHYAVIEHADTTPVIVDEAVVKTSAHHGPIRSQGLPLGDLTFVARRHGDAAGKAAIAFACDDAMGGACVSASLAFARPFFAVQTAGRGLLE